MLIVDEIYRLVILSTVVTSISWTVTQEEIFAEFRDLCVEQIRAGKSLLVRKFFYLFTCEYCFSHWVTLVLIVVTEFQLVFSDWRGYAIAFFVLPWVANIWMSLYRRLRVEIKHQNAKAENELKD